MKLLTYQTKDTEPRLGFIHNNQVIDMEDFGEISNFPLPTSMLELIDMGFEIIDELNSMIADTEPAFFEEIAYEMDEIIFLAPIPKPRRPAQALPRPPERLAGRQRRAPDSSRLEGRRGGGPRGRW